MTDQNLLSEMEPRGRMRLPGTGVPRTRWARTVDGVWIAYHDIGGGPRTLIFTTSMYSHLEVRARRHEWSFRRRRDRQT